MVPVRLGRVNKVPSSPQPHSHRAWSTAKQRPQSGSGTLLALQKMRILYLGIIQESRWDTTHRSKWWLCLSVLPGKALQLGQLRPSLVTAYKPFLLGFQQWVSLPSDTSEHFILKRNTLWWSKAPCETWAVIPSKTQPPFLWNINGSLLISKGKQQELWCPIYFIAINFWHII